MKNLYALNNSKDLINILDVDKTKVEKYFCLQCGDELIARKGEINKHHFSHKNKIDCNYETYLHKLGKLVFYNTYNDCLENNKPFFVDFETMRNCNTCIKIENINRICEIESHHGKFDLTKTFNEIYLEEHHNGFVPDVLLKSKETDDVIFIEIFVTHSCENDKIESGIRVIEIEVRNENDLSFISDLHFKNNIENCRFYNFKIKTIEKNFIDVEQCEKTAGFFSIYKNGKARVRELFIKDLNIELLNENLIYKKVLDFSEDNNFIGHHYKKLIIEASQSGVKFKNCFACRFFATNKSDFFEATLFCKKKKEYVKNSNDGSDCDKFWRVE